MLYRKLYLDRIRPFYDDFGMIKVLIGLRRSGKSVILSQIEEELLGESGKSVNIIRLNLDEEGFLNIRRPSQLHAAIKKRYREETANYIFIDEIQKVKNYEPIVEAYRLKGNCSIFLTGSNSYLLSGDLTTKLTGRYIAFNIYPFCFGEAFEYGKLRGSTDREKLFDYLEYGGLPKRFDYDEELVSLYVREVIGEIIEKDLSTKARDKDLFIRILRFIVSNSGATISANSLLAYLKSEKILTTRKTITKYLELMEKAKIVEFCRAYDIRGKKILRRSEKCYIADFSLRQYFPLSENYDIGLALETLVYNELRVRRYDVYVGKFRNGEVDFVATKGKKKIYFQVAYIMETSATKEREFQPLLKVKDNYPKYVISMDLLDQSNLGIKNLHLVEDFLLSNEWEK